jgi:hypothetical protein
MRRSLSRRALSLALTLWLPLFMSGADSVVRCPAHNGVRHSSAAHVASEADAAAAHDHGMEHSGPADHEAGHNCSCPGPGCCPPAVAVVPSVIMPLAAIALVHEARAVSSLDLFSSVREHLLPFATAPPAVRLAPAGSLVA